MRWDICVCNNGAISAARDWSWTILSVGYFVVHSYVSPPSWYYVPHGKVPHYPPPQPPVPAVYDQERDRDNPYLSGWSGDNHTITASNNISSVPSHALPPHLSVNRAHLQKQYKYSLSSSNTLISPELSGRYHRDQSHRDHSLRTTSSDLYSAPSHAYSFHHLYALPRKPYGTTKGGDPRGDIRSDSRGDPRGDSNSFDRRPASLTKFKHSHRHKTGGQRSKSHQQQRHGHRTVHDHGTSMHRGRAGDPKRTYAGVPLGHRAMTYNPHHRRDIEWKLLNETQ